MLEAAAPVLVGAVFGAALHASVATIAFMLATRWPRIRAALRREAL